MAVGTEGGGARGQLATPVFDRSVNPILTRGKIMPITLLCDPLPAQKISNLPTALRSK